MRSAFFRAALVAGVALVLSGCSTEDRVTGPLPVRSPLPPAASTPSNAIRLFERGWTHRDPDAFREILAGDFRFNFAQRDSSGNPFRADPIGRDELLGILDHLFRGGGSAPPATRVCLVMDPALRPLPDSRPGKNPAWHQVIVTSVDLTIQTAGGPEYRVLGSARFFVARGDSAVIPADLAAQGVRPDPTRWYIDRWEDETFPEGRALPRAVPAMLQPEFSASWGYVLALYHQIPGALRS
jgi:hypothetical protein